MFEQVSGSSRDAEFNALQRGTPQTVLVVGGYGFFGGRICAALAKNPAIRLLIGGRSANRGRDRAAELGLPQEQSVVVDVAEGVGKDRGRSLRELLIEHRVTTIVHTAGPFQGQDYSVARAAIEAGCHYIDLADGRAFVAGISTLDASAKEHAVTVVGGASSVPALSCAVVDRYIPQFQRLDSIRVGISSGARAPGIATVRGVFGYAGQAIRILEGGSWTDVYGWRGLERHRFPPPLGPRWMGFCDVPDLDLLPRRYPTVSTASFQAGFASDLGHLVVWGLAGLVKAGILRSMAPFAVPLNRLSRWMEPLVSDKGGMFVSLKGLGNDGQLLRITWNLIAEHNDGPFIPCGASIVLATKLAGGATLPHGAMPCVGLLTVEEYLASLDGLAVREIVE